MKLRKILLLGFILSSCIDPFEQETTPGDRIVVVDGLITTAPGPHKVRLTQATQYSSQRDGNRVSLTGATVYLEDENEEKVYLEERILTDILFCEPPWADYRRYFLARGQIRDVYIPTGEYFTPEWFAAKVGSTYTLHISTPAGKSYKSKPETVIPTPQLKQVEFRPFSTATINPLIESKGIDILATFDDPPGESNFYFWQASNAVVTLIAEPELTPPRRGGPKDCCDRCYMPDLKLNNAFSTLSDELFNGLTTTQIMFQIMDDGLRFKERYRVQLNQYAISQEAHRFLRLVRQQLDIQGSVFDPPPANIRGNMLNVEQADQQVLGYFFAVDVSKQTLYINRTDIPAEFLAKRLIVPGDCREYCGILFEPPTLEPPEDWVF